MFRCQRLKLARAERHRRNLMRAKDKAWAAYHRMPPCREKREVLEYLTVRQYKLGDDLGCWNFIREMAEAMTPKMKAEVGE